MSKWKKKPVVIEAFLWTGGIEQTEDPQWIIDAMENGTVGFVDSGTPNIKLTIKTLEGVMEANQGDYIIQGVKGELYPCKPDIFEMTYDKAPKDWRERLQIEHDELGDKCDKLVNALANHDVPEDQRPMLSIQFNTMHAYLQILKLRLDS